MFENPKPQAQIPIRVIFLVLFLALLWGGNTSAVKFSLTEFKPLAIAGIRFLIGMIVAIVWALTHKIPIIPKRSDLPRLLLIGVIFAVQISLFNWATEMTHAGRSALMLNTYPLFVAILAHFLVIDDRLTKLKLIGSLLAFGGVAIVFRDGLINSNGSLIGDLFGVISGILLALTVVMTKRFLRTMNQFQILIPQMLIGNVIFFAMSWILEGGSEAYGFSVIAIGGLLYQGIIVAGFCFLTWVSILKLYPPSKLSVYFFTTPLWGITFGHFLFDEPITILLAIGAILVSTGIYVVSRSKT